MSVLVVRFKDLLLGKSSTRRKSYLQVRVWNCHYSYTVLWRDREVSRGRIDLRPRESQVETEGYLRQWSSEGTPCRRTECCRRSRRSWYSKVHVGTTPRTGVSSLISLIRCFLQFYNEPFWRLNHGQRRPKVVTEEYFTRSTIFFFFERSYVYHLRNRTFTCTLFSFSVKISGERRFVSLMTIDLIEDKRLVVDVISRDRNYRKLYELRHNSSPIPIRLNLYLRTFLESPRRLLCLSPTLRPSLPTPPTLSFPFSSP